ncbi:hypothetical protein Tsubulata_011059 [Turnera subulata]|uniref:NAC domain-containing protein n=1 Tax=Turnera subulata TaxID=218843 RepID=A0A9Q0J1A2_9ROSI|nr:hypothetical protein Tsubulata_011059 [Turnera subulata]
MDARAFLPPGFRFQPSDECLIAFLKEKVVHGTQFPLIPEVDANKTDPWLLPGIHQDHPHLNDRERFYFFRRERKHKGGKRPRRSMDDDVLNGGKWIASTGNKEIFSGEALDHEKVIIGYKRTLNFFIPPPNKTIKTTREKKISRKKGDMIKTEWIMHEYTLFGEEFQEWAVCRIKNKAKEPKEDHQQQEQEQQQEGEEDHHQDYTYFGEAGNLHHQTDNIMPLMPPVASQDHELPLSYNYVVDTAPSSANNMQANLAANPQEQQQHGVEDQDGYTYIQEAINSDMPPPMSMQDDHELPQQLHPHEPPASYNIFEDTTPSLESTANNNNSNMYSPILAPNPEQDEQQQGQDQDDDSTYFDWSILRDPYDYQHPDHYQPSDGFLGFNGFF